ncbi:U1 zinc finger family protein [Corchorus olitorius]|uniref:U1 zinc finger family protein n=1 Tax=Corchorus olitorius TaxID=93759 RepID=A0A1R3GY38_9ROSI|nr:U1 zinc finger family protein [Corchorus olitorius]
MARNSRFVLKVKIGIRKRESSLTKVNCIFSLHGDFSPGGEEKVIVTRLGVTTKTVENGVRVMKR